MLRKITGIDQEGARYVFHVDENGVYQGPFEKRFEWGTIVGFHKDGKMDGPAKLTANSGYTSDHVYRAGVELSGEEAEKYLREWKAARDREEEAAKPRLDFTLLSGDENLEVMDRYGKKVAPTDLAILLGCAMTGAYERTSEGDLTCYSLLSNLSNIKSKGLVYAIDTEGMRCWPAAEERIYSIRPVLMPKDTEKLTPTATKKGVNGVDIVEYGEYPQNVADKETSAELDELFKSKSLQPTGKIYTFDGIGPGNSEDPFSPTQYYEYEYNGKKYVKIDAFPYDRDSLLSNNEKALGKEYWVQVEPVEWLKDLSGVWVSKKCLFSGIQIDSPGDYHSTFEDTFMKQYLDTYFAKEVEPFEREEDRVRKATIKGLKEQLERATDPEAVKKAVGFSKTPERRTQAERIIRVRRAKEILSSAAKKANTDGDEQTLQEIMEIARPYAARDAAIRNKFRLKRAERRAKKGRE